MGRMRAESAHGPGLSSPCDGTTEQPSAPRTVERLWRAVAAIDLAMVKAKLVESRGWTPAQATRVDREYRRFLTLTLAHPETAIVPSVIVDEMWHAHILDTRAYAADCARTFGFFLHHFPYFGKRGPDDALALSSSFRHTLELYEAAFGPPSPDYWLHKDDGPTAAACSTDSECYGCSGSEGGCAGR